VSGGAVVAIVVALFFVIGVTVGVIAVIALSAVRREREHLVRDETDNETAASILGASGIPGHWDGAPSDDRPPRPGDADNG
jgi:hypothetical protein